MAIELSKINFKALAGELLNKDSDKIITKGEISNFISSKESELMKANISTISAANELKSLLKENLEENQKTSDGNNSSSNGAKGEKSGSFVEEFNRLKAQIEEFEAQIQQYNSELEVLNAAQEELSAEFEKEQAKYQNLEQTLQEENEAYKKTIQTINQAAKEMQTDAQHQQKQAVYDAMADYNPDEDGEWDEFLANYTGEISLDSGLKSKLNGLISKSDFIGSNLSALGSSLSQQAKKVNNLNVEITTNISQIKSVSDSLNIATTSLASAQEELSNSILNLVSEEEMNLVENNNINLSEKLPDGSPRYIFAKGKSDNAYHIYDMGADRAGASLARQYGCDGGSLRGDNIVPVGNGYINGYNVLEDGAEGGEEIFYLSDDGSLGSKKACYCTCSPLSFDLEGDGVKTSSKVINYDIDGDGVIDRINDSADAVLVFDKDGDGISGADGSETFGNNTDLDGDGKKDGFKDGFEALKALAKKENLIDGKNDNSLDEKDLAHLEQKYGLKIKAGGYNSEAKSLKDVGITNINLAQTDKTTMNDNFDGKGNQLMTQQGATFTVNGKTREYADIWHKKQDENFGFGNSASDLQKSDGENMFEKHLNSSLSFDAEFLEENVKIDNREGLEAVENSKELLKKLFGHK